MHCGDSAIRIRVITLEIIHELTASGKQPLASESMNLAVFENEHAGGGVITGKPDMEVLAQAMSLMSTILGSGVFWHTTC